MTKKKEFVSTILSYTLGQTKYMKVQYLSCRLGTGGYWIATNYSVPMGNLRYQFEELLIPNAHLTLTELIDLCIELHIPLDFVWSYHIYETGNQRHSRYDINLKHAPRKETMI